MKFVYILTSQSHPGKIYTGITGNLKQRLALHNAGEIKPTKAYRPWALVTYLVFKDHSKAYQFEKYLKSGSGIAFRNKRLLC